MAECREAGDREQTHSHCAAFHLWQVCACAESELSKQISSYLLQASLLFSFFLNPTLKKDVVDNTSLFKAKEPELNIIL